MRKLSWLTLMVVAVVAFFGLTGWTRGANTSVKAWEYKVISTYETAASNPPPDLQQLNNAGAEGWELVAIRSGSLPQTHSQQIRTDYYFKR